MHRTPLFWHDAEAPAAARPVVGLRCFFWQAGKNPRSSRLALPCCGGRAVALHRLFHYLDTDSARPRFISEAATEDARFFSVVPCTVRLVFCLTRSISDDVFTTLSYCAENAKCYRPPSAPYVKDTPGTWTLTVEFAKPFFGENVLLILSSFSAKQKCIDLLMAQLTRWESLFAV